MIQLGANPYPEHDGPCVRAWCDGCGESSGVEAGRPDDTREEAEVFARLILAGMGWRSDGDDGILCPACAAR